MVDSVSEPEPVEYISTRKPREYAHRSLPADVAGSLHQARRDKGWSLRRAARHVGIAHGHLDYLEKGQRRPSLVVAEALIAHLALDSQAAERLRSVAVTDAGRSSPWRAGRHRY